jgi:hypothetical protein
VVRDLNGYKAPGPNDFWKSVGRLCKRRVVMQLLSLLSQKRLVLWTLWIFVPLT